MTPDPEASSPRSENQRETISDTGVKTTASSQLPTLGERLVREAQRIASSHMPAYPWLRLLDPVMKRVSSLPVPSQARFQRTEADHVAEPSRPASHEPFAEAGISWSGQQFPYPDTKEQLVEGEAKGWTQSFSYPTVKDLLSRGSSQAPGQPFSYPTASEPLSEGSRQTPGQSFSYPTASESLSEGSRQTPGQSFSYPTVKDLLSRGSSQAPGQPLSPYIQQRLRDFVGPGTEAIRVLTDETANAITHTQWADAVTVGEQVFFRKGHFRPHEDEGFALLTHEAMHVVQAMRPGAAWLRATQVGVQEEEREAGVQERNVLHARREVAFPPKPTQRPMPASRSPAIPEHQASVERYSIRSERGSLMPEPAISTSPAHRPMAAPAERTLDNATPPAPPVPDVEDLKRTLYRDLMKQIRADLERGG